MHVIIAIDGSRQSLSAARHLKSFADPTRITDISIVGVIRPLAAVAFADEISAATGSSEPDMRTFREAAEEAMLKVAVEFDDRGPKVHRRPRSARLPTRSSRRPSSPGPVWWWSPAVAAASATPSSWAARPGGCSTTTPKKPVARNRKS